MNSFDIAPFALPNSPPGEFHFEESRDIQEVVIRFKKKQPRTIRLHYWQHNWPQSRPEESADTENPATFGWMGTDDWFNGQWRRAALRRRTSGNTVTLTFRGLKADELPDTPAGYEVTFRRTMALKLELPNWDEFARISIHTRSLPTQTVLRVELDAGKRTPGKKLAIGGYNTWIFGVEHMKKTAIIPVMLTLNRTGSGRDYLADAGTREHALAAGRGLQLKKGRGRSFHLVVHHMEPAHRYCGDDGLVEFHLDRDTFTISLEALAVQGPVWYAKEGIFITRADDPTTFADYRKQHAREQTVSQQIAAIPEHSLARAFFGQPRPHAVAYSFGCKHSPQRFWLEANGDLVLHRRNLAWIDRPGKSADRFLNAGDARFFFHLEDWVATGRHTDPPPVPAYNLHLRKGNLLLEQNAFCVPLEKSILASELTYDDPTVALLRFRFTNAGDRPLEASLPIAYSEQSGRTHNALLVDAGQTDYLVPESPKVPLKASRGRLTSPHRGKPVLRGTYTTTMRLRNQGTQISFRRKLAPGETCELLLKIPYIALGTPAELGALDSLDFAAAHGELTRFWRAENRRGSQLRTPIPQLDTLYAAHLTHIQFSDFAMPDDPDLLNTSVGTSTYGNFSNESCMIVQEMEQRSFHDDCRRRIDLWIKYQGTVPQPGNFADYEGMFYGAGGFEQGNYNQHHGWVLWALAEHFLVTRDEKWFSGAADAAIAGADWIFRQRKTTLDSLPHSRGWERGFLPAGSLEDVTEFYYWLSTNALTWRAADSTARALETSGHPEASRIRTEADAYRRDLLRGFETMRRHTPLVRLRDGRWVPHYPSRLYCRGRDQGWIREVLEGAVYLLISGLYSSDSREAGWILDDFQDNLYHTPPFGYVLRDPEKTLISRGGFSIQPCLLAGLLPHLDRDEPELYLWMLFNAIAAVYRDEISGMIEHPLPELGFSNSVTIKTSDEANAVTWIRYLFVYWTPDLLHFGRALPRAWFAADTPLSIDKVATHHGTVAVTYQSDLSQKRITATLDLGKLRDDPKILVRFRHPEKSSIQSVEVNGESWTRFSGEDVDITGQTGKIKVEIHF